MGRGTSHIQFRTSPASRNRAPRPQCGVGFNDESGGRVPGFTLIELLVALTLLTVAVLGITRLMTVVILGNRDSRSVNTASVLGQDLLEDARRSAALPSVGTDDYGTIPGYPEFKREVVREENTPAVGLTTVTVTVHWDGDARSYRLQTIVAQ